MRLDLTRRRHVDLVRVSSASCRAAALSCRAAA
ncbi:putative leader peptide [Streptomyces collinus]